MLICQRGGSIGSSSVGGFFGFRMYSLGIQSICITGRATQPVFLCLGLDSIEMKSAENLWDLNTRETEEHLKQKWGARDLFRIGERIVHMEKIINLRQGSSRADDNLPELFLKTPVKNGPIQGRTVNLAPIGKAFYREMGWNKSGQPQPSVLTKFGLNL